MSSIKILKGFYTDLFKDLSVDTINTPTFKLMLEFDILSRFNYRTSNKELNSICEDIKKSNTRRYKK